MARARSILVLSVLTALTASLGGCSCAEPTAEPDARMSEDAAVSGDGGLDAPSREDALETPDAPEAPDATSVDAVSASDAACTNGMEGPMPMGICDGRGMTGCRLWAEENASGAPAMAICIQAGTGGCARADACADARDVSTCTCGDGPACEPGEVCTLDAGTGRGACTCVTRTGP